SSSRGARCSLTGTSGSLTSEPGRAAPVMDRDVTGRAVVWCVVGWDVAGWVVVGGGLVGGFAAVPHRVQ
ncbi:MAG TPA: hypothetical protein VJT72_06605, partial [Pseudonocardiaceae bacterium]|nr:hypothetical protein [Pseudonocardiaceae bacterium]